MKLLKVYTDWGSRWNPGESWIGVYITNSKNQELEKRYKYLWKKTNNEAEYLWAYYGIQRALEIWATDIELFMDSKLVIQQLSGDWKIKKKELKSIFNDIQKILTESWISIKYIWIEREKNKEADRLSNVAMDKKN